MLNGRLAALNRFISRFMDKCMPFFQAIKKNKIRRNQECEAMFQSLKKYLTSLPLPSKPVTGETLFLYLAVSELAVSGVLVRKDGGE